MVSSAAGQWLSLRETWLFELVVGSPGIRTETGSSSGSPLISIFPRPRDTHSFSFPSASRSNATIPLAGDSVIFFYYNSVPSHHHDQNSN